MQFVLMFTHTPQVDAQLDPEAKAKLDRDTFDWFMTQPRERFAQQGAQLQPVETATTVAGGEAEPVVTNGGFSDAAQVVGGFTVIDVPDRETAVEMVRSWPPLRHPGNAVEIRPVVEHG